MEFATEQRDCDALNGLFQQTVGNLKGSFPVWDDFLSKTTKLHLAIRTVAVSTAAFLDAFQKIADLANSSRGVTREMGAALTRLCIRQRSVEVRMKEFASSLIEALVDPLQLKMDDWKKATLQLERDHNREYKKSHQEIKKVLLDTARLSKRSSKGGPDVQFKYDQTAREAREKLNQLETSEKNAVRLVMTEEQGRFGYFVECLKPVMDAEIEILAEMNNLTDVMDSLSNLTNDSGAVPQSIERVMIDLKEKEPSISFKTCTSGSSPLSGKSRKLSSCSLTSSTSSESTSELATMSPTHHHHHNHHHDTISHSNSVSDDNIQLCLLRKPSSLSSQDSGFMSQEVTSSDVNRDKSLDACYIKGSLERLQQQVSHSPNSSLSSRPHTISSAAFERVSVRPSLTNQTYVDLLSDDTSAVKSTSISSIYSSPPNNASALRQQRVTDIQSRLSVIYARRASQTTAGSQLPTLPAEYAPSYACVSAENPDARSISSKPVRSSASPAFHRSCSLPPPKNDLALELANSTHSALRQKFLMVAEDTNHISSTACCDFNLQPLQDMDSMLNGHHQHQHHNEFTVDESRKFMTLPRNCLPFRIPQVPARVSSAAANGKVKPPPPARRYSMKSEAISSTSLNKLEEQQTTMMLRNGAMTVDQDDVFLHNIKVAAGGLDQVRQQDPPKDQDGDVLWLPSASSTTSQQLVAKPSVVLEWSSEEPRPLDSSLPPGTCVVEPSCSRIPPSSSSSSPSPADDHSEEKGTSESNTLEMIRRGVKLRKTFSLDRSAPRLTLH